MICHVMANSLWVVSLWVKPSYQSASQSDKKEQTLSLQPHREEQSRRGAGLHSKWLHKMHVRAVLLKRRRLAREHYRAVHLLNSQWLCFHSFIRFWWSNKVHTRNGFAIYMLLERNNENERNSLGSFPPNWPIAALKVSAFCASVCLCRYSMNEYNANRKYNESICLQNHEKSSSVDKGL